MACTDNRYMNLIEIKVTPVIAASLLRYVSMQRLWKRYQKLLENDLSTQIFDNVKNLVVCALLFAAGTDALRGTHDLFMGILASNMAGWGLIALSTILLVLNVSDGIRRLANLRYHLLLQISLILIYVIISMRVVEIVWGFRSS